VHYAHVTHPISTQPAHVAARPLAFPALATLAELLKRVTWFPPMWAFGCAVVASGASLADRWALVLVGVLLSGPLVCATSQAVNDWFDRHVDAINEPQRPIPSGRMPGRWGLYVAWMWTALSLAVATWLGPWGFAAAVLGLLLARAHSAPPWPSLLLAALCSAGAHGIMTLNDFKSIEGDQQTGIGSLPVRLGVQRAAQVACFTMVLPQVIVVLLLLNWQQSRHALAVAALLAAQVLLMRRFLTDPRKLAIWYSGLGVTLFVLGILVSAFALRGLTP
jgi:chlorophyll/bacteriochlorophyll a synthase